MACEECAGARACPQYHRRYDLRCPWCGARYVKQLRERDIPRKELDAWRARVMDDWEKFGHDRLQLRELAMQRALPVEPEGAKCR